MLNYLENIFNRSYCKKYVIKKFIVLKIIKSTFNNINLKFICFNLDLTYRFEMII